MNGQSGWNLVNTTIRGAGQGAVTAYLGLIPGGVITSTVMGAFGGAGTTIANNVADNGRTTVAEASFGALQGAIGGAFGGFLADAAEAPGVNFDGVEMSKGEGALVGGVFGIAAEALGAIVVP